MMPSPPEHARETSRRAALQRFDDALAELRALPVDAAGDDATRAEYVRNILESVAEVLVGRGAVEFSDVQALYRRFASEQLLVRREDPERLIHAMGDQESLPVAFDPSRGKPYANVGVWPDGLSNAFIEGWGGVPHTGIVGVVGFRPAHVTVMDIPPESKQFHGLDRRFVRSAEGSIPAEDVRFVVLRIPRKYFPQGALTATEEVAETPFVFRGYAWE